MSQATAKKSENISSAIGRKPVIAAPIAAPTMACSLIGVSRTRSPPNSVEQALGQLEHAAGRADVLADEHHARVAAHLLRDRRGECGSVRQFRHDEPPSVQTWVSRTSGRRLGRGPRDGLGVGDRGVRLGVDRVEVGGRHAARLEDRAR